MYLYVADLKIALQSIFAYTLRAFLTLIGIIIGVASVVTVGASISGLNTYVIDKLGKILGSNHFMIARMAFGGDMGGGGLERRLRGNRRVRWDDWGWMWDRCGTCEFVGAATRSGNDLKQDGIEFPGTCVSPSTSTTDDI